MVGFGGRQRLFRRDADVPAVNGVDLDIAAGEMVAVVGGSGSGKTTLGRAMLRLIPTSGGEIRFHGRDVTATQSTATFRLASPDGLPGPVFLARSAHARRRDRGRAAAPRARSWRPANATGASRRCWTRSGLPASASAIRTSSPAASASAIAIARAIVRQPAFVVADEPVSALDMTIQAQVLELFERLQAQYGFACLFISHDLGVVEQVADRVVVMQGGRIVEQGSRDDIFDRPQHDYTKALLAAAPVLDFEGTATVRASG